jgi:DNA-binding MarR family transcriptional regulator
MTDNSRKIFDYLKANYGAKLTGNDIKDALGVSISAVTGSVNGLVKKGHAVRNEVTVVGADNKPAIVKYITLTDAGLDFDPDAEVEKKAKK